MVLQDKVEAVAAEDLDESNTGVIPIFFKDDLEHKREQTAKGQGELYELYNTNQQGLEYIQILEHEIKKTNLLVWNLKNKRAEQAAKKEGRNDDIRRQIQKQEREVDWNYNLTMQTLEDERDFKNRNHAVISKLRERLIGLVREVGKDDLAGVRDELFDPAHPYSCINPPSTQPENSNNDDASSYVAHTKSTTSSWLAAHPSAVELQNAQARGPVEPNDAQQPESHGSGLLDPVYLNNPNYQTDLAAMYPFVSQMPGFGGQNDLQV